VGKGQKIFYRWHTKAVKVKGTQSTNKATLYKNKGEWGGGGVTKPVDGCKLYFYRTEEHTAEL